MNFLNSSAKINYKFPEERGYHSYSDILSHSPQYGMKLSEIGCWRALINKYSDDPFFQEIQKKISCAKGYETRTDSTLYVPNAPAVQWHADRYRDKYGIEIFVTTDEKLFDLIKECKYTMTGYVGIITGGNWDKENDDHVTPLLFYFPDRENLEDDTPCQCLILDSLGRDNYSEALEEKSLSQCNIYISTYIRQADDYSCRTDALALLRNALLSLKYHGYTDGFGKVLEEGEIEGNTIIELPPEWDFTAQLANDLLEEKHLVIRRFFGEKTKQSETAIEHRKKHTQSKEFACTIWGCSSYPIESLPQEEIIFTQKLNPQNTYNFELKFKITRTVSTYLLYKGLKNSQL